MLGCGLSRLSSSLTTCIPADPAQADTRSHERTIVHRDHLLITGKVYALHHTSRDFLFADPLVKGTCEEQTVSHLMSCGRVVEEVSHGETFARSVRRPTARSGTGVRHNGTVHMQVGSGTRGASNPRSDYSGEDYYDDTR